MSMDELIPTRATLLNRLKDLQDQPSWRDFYNIYSRLILDRGFKAGLTRVEAEDVLQETMITVARHMPTFRYDPSIGSFKSWLFTITKWRIADQLRKRDPGNKSSETATMESIVDPATDQSDTGWEKEWEQSVVEAAIANIKHRVDPEKFQMFDLTATKGMKPDRVAELFQLPVGQVYLARHRVKELLVDEVERLKHAIT